MLAIVASLIALFSASAAWAAIIVQHQNAKAANAVLTNNAARNSRASVVSANRQKWIDAIRDDVSDFVATRYQVVALKYAGSFSTDGQDALLTEERELRARLVMLRVRIELRINRIEADHTDLLAAMDRFDQEASSDADSALRLLASKIFKAEWERLKKEASGIDPLVREVDPTISLEPLPHGQSLPG